MPHIVLVSTSYPSTEDGSEAAGSFVADFAHMLSEQVKVSVVAPSLTTKAEHINENLTIHRFAVPHLPLSLLKPHNPLHWRAIFKTLYAGQSALHDVVACGTVDHIFAFWVLPSGYWAQKIKQQHNIPYSTWALGSDIWSLGKIPLIKNLLTQVLRHSHINFADGYLLKQDVEQLSQRICTFLPSTRLLTLPTLPPLKTQPPYILAFLGRWHSNKGIDLLLESLKHLTVQDWQHIAEVRIAGGGAMQASVREACSALQAQGYPIVLQGYLSKAAAIDWFVSADYVLIPSRIESIPVVFSDAMKCQCPVISMPVGDLPRLLRTYQVGYLADNVTAHAYTSAIQAALSKPPTHFKPGLERAQYDFSLERSVQIFLDTCNVD